MWMPKNNRHRIGTPSANPNGIQIHQPGVGGPSRIGEESLPWETVPTNSSTLKGVAFNPPQTGIFYFHISAFLWHDCQQS
jgi:hypothetical protein